MQARDLLSYVHEPRSTDAASWITGSLADTVRAFEDTLRELAFRITDAEAAARLDTAAGLLSSGRILTEDASALLADTGLESSELAALRAAGLPRQLPGPASFPPRGSEQAALETLGRYHCGLPPRNARERTLIARLAKDDFRQAWEDAKNDHLFPPPGTGSPGHSACQPGACPFGGSAPAGAAAAAAAARNLAERMREDHFANGTATREPGPHFGPGCQEEGTCPWKSTSLPVIERSARALAREHLLADALSERPGPARSSRARPSRRVTADEPGEAKSGSRMPRTPHALSTESFPQGPAAGLHPGNGAGTFSGQSAYGAARRQPGQSLKATTRRGPR